MRKRIDDFIDARHGEKRFREKKPEPCDNIEELVKLTAEVTVAEAVRAILAELKQLRQEIEQLRRELSQHKSIDARGRRGSRRSNLADKLLEALSEEGYILASESKEKLGVSPYKLRELAQQTGSRIIPLEGDLAVVDPEAYREFLMLLASATTSDPEEAARRMGRYKKLFEKLRRSSMVYYDARRGSWRMLE